MHEVVDVTVDYDLGHHADRKDDAGEFFGDATFEEFVVRIDGFVDCFECVGVVVVVP